MLLLVVGCARGNSNYQDYAPTQQAQPSVGGGCSVSAPDYQEPEVIHINGWQYL